jgi:phage head maturation protease
MISTLGEGIGSAYELRLSIEAHGMALRGEAAGQVREELAGGGRVRVEELV